MTDRISLEKEALEFSIANTSHPRIYEVESNMGRNILNEVQDSPVFKHAVDIEDQQMHTGKWGGRY